MSKQMVNTSPVVSRPITKELAEARRSAVVTLLTALKARITARNIVFMAGSNMPVENLGGEVDIADYAQETDLYSVGDDVEYLAADLMPVDDLGLFMPACIIKRRRGGTKGGSYILDTTVYHIVTGDYARDAVMPLVDALNAVDDAIASATADHLTALGVTIERHYVCNPQNDGNVLPFVKMGEATARDYAQHVRLCADEQMASTSIVRTWHHTSAGWLVTNEANSVTGGEYCYSFRVPA